MLFRLLHARIDAMDVIKIDDVGVQPTQARFTGLLDITGPAVSRGRPVRFAHIAEFTGYHITIAPPGDGAPDQQFVFALRIGVGPQSNTARSRDGHR